MSKNSDKVKNTVARRGFITLAGSFLGVTGASALLLSGSAVAAEKGFPKDLHDSIAAYGTKVSKDKKDLAVLRNELGKLLKSFKNGEDLEKSCRTFFDGRPELARMMMPQNGADRPSFILFILVLIIVILVESKID